MHSIVPPVPAPFIAYGRLGASIQVSPTTVTIARDGGKFIRNIPLHLITSVEYRAAAALASYGHIKLFFAGSEETKAAWAWSGMLNQNMVQFTRKQQPAFWQAKVLIEQFQQQQRPFAPMPPVPNPMTSYDELERLAELRDKGVITIADFEAKKRQILGL